MTKFGFALYFFYLGEPARLRGRRFQASQNCFNDPSLRNVVSSCRAVGLSVTMFYAITSYRAYAIHPYEQLLLYGRIAYALMSKNISTSIPLALPSATSPRFAANHPIPSPAPFSRAANPASGSSLKTIRTLPASGYRYATADAVGRGSDSSWPCGLEIPSGLWAGSQLRPRSYSEKKSGSRVKTAASDRKRRHSLSR